MLHVHNLHDQFTGYKRIVNCFSIYEIAAMADLSGPKTSGASGVFVAFDTETTGIWAPANRIVELGAVKFRLDSHEKESFQSLVNPERKIPPIVIDIHGITDEMVSSAPTIGPVLRKFREFCGEDSILVAHNALFDISFVGCELDRTKEEFGDNVILDTVDICRQLYPGLPSYSLLQLVTHFDIAHSQEHRALADAEFVHQLVRQATKDHPDAMSPTTFKSDLAGDQRFSSYHMSAWQAEPTILPDEFAELQTALDQGGRVEINYQTPPHPPSKRVIHPQALHSIGDCIYINAICERSNEERTFRLDRILDFRLLED